jgi:uncharacterized repeat protein (TIGR03837 family)
MHRLTPPSPLTFDVFCQVIDNHGDLGVCWRLSEALGQRGHTVRLWVDNPDALSWLAPHGAAGVSVLTWTAATATRLAQHLAPANVWIEGFGCEITPEFIAIQRDYISGSGIFHSWINLEYLSAEPYVERMHGLQSPLMHGPGKGWSRRFFYPGFTSGTGGLLRSEYDDAWLSSATASRQPPAPDKPLNLFLFCYEPVALAPLMHSLSTGHTPWHMQVAPGRPTQWVHSLLGKRSVPAHPLHMGALSIEYLQPTSQHGFDTWLRGSDFNCVRGEDSLVRALWAAQPFLWHIYPQDDGVHLEKLDAFIQWLAPPPDWRNALRTWNTQDSAAPLSIHAHALPDWRSCALEARQRLLDQQDLATQLLAMISNPG